MSDPTGGPLGLWGGFGIEIEYMIVDAATLDGAAVGMNVGSEHEWGAFTRVVDVPAGSTVQLVLHLRGVVKPGPYRLVVRPQPTAQATDWSVRTAVAGGETIKFTGALQRRSVISATGVDAGTAARPAATTRVRLRPPCPRW